MASRSALVTPRGRAIYPHLNTPDTKFKAEGEYTCKLAVPTAIAEDIIAQIDAAHAEAQKSAIEEINTKAKAKNPKAKPVTSVKEANLPYKLNPENDEETLFNFKMKASFKGKDGSMVSMRPALFDAKGKALSKDVKVGGGSVLRVSFEPASFYTATVGAGVTLRLKAVQVIELRSFGGGTADSFGFEAEEGFVAEDAPAATEETPAQAEETTTTTTDGDGSDF